MTPTRKLVGYRNVSDVVKRMKMNSGAVKLMEGVKLQKRLENYKSILLH